MPGWSMAFWGGKKKGATTSEWRAMWPTSRRMMRVSLTEQREAATERLRGESHEVRLMVGEKKAVAVPHNHGHYPAPLGGGR